MVAQLTPFLLTSSWRGALLIEHRDNFSFTSLRIYRDFSTSLLKSEHLACAQLRAHGNLMTL
jgi:hypothetical protein